MKRLIKVMLVVVLFSVTTIGVEASEEFEVSKGEAVFSLEDLESGDRLVYENSELKYSIEVVKETEESALANIQVLSLKNSTYTISYKSLTEDISYKVVINNNNFTHVHSGNYSVVGYFVESSSLRLVTPKFATYSFANKLLLREWTSSLDARINTSNELVVAVVN